jgi:hypothetical protein
MTALQVPAKLGAVHRSLLARLGAFFNSKRRKNLRLYLTAGVSVADLGSDVFSVSVNYLAGNTGVASALLATVLLSMSFQILIVVVVHRHHGKRRLMLEILFVIAGVKPFVDVWRILNGKVNVGAPMDTKSERAGCKVAEIVVESVPTALIQMYDLIGATKLSFATVFSIVMSCLCIATITTGMFFDYDTDPASRVHSPMFYGAVPDSAIRKLLVRVRCAPMWPHALEWRFCAGIPLPLCACPCHGQAHHDPTPLQDEPCRAASLPLWRHGSIPALQARSPRFPILDTHRWGRRVVGRASLWQALR